MENDILLKKRLFGGFDRKQVIDYLNRLQKENSDKSIKSEIDKLQSEISEIRKTLTEKDVEIAVLRDKVSTLNAFEDGSQDRMTALESAKKAVKLAESTTDEIISSASAEISEKVEKIERLFKKLSGINEQIDSLDEHLTTLDERLGRVPFDVDLDDLPDIADMDPSKSDEVRSFGTEEESVPSVEASYIESSISEADKSAVSESNVTGIQEDSPENNTQLTHPVNSVTENDNETDFSGNDSSDFDSEEESLTDPVSDEQNNSQHSQVSETEPGEFDDFPDMSDYKVPVPEPVIMNENADIENDSIESTEKSANESKPDDENENPDDSFDNESSTEKKASKKLKSKKQLHISRRQKKKNDVIPVENEPDEASRDTDLNNNDQKNGSIGLDSIDTVTAETPAPEFSITIADESVDRPRVTSEISVANTEKPYEDVNDTENVEISSVTSDNCEKHSDDYQEPTLNKTADLSSNTSTASSDNRVSDSKENKSEDDIMDEKTSKTDDSAPRAESSVSNKEDIPTESVEQAAISDNSEHETLYSDTNKTNDSVTDAKDTATTENLDESTQIDLSCDSCTSSDSNTSTSDSVENSNDSASSDVIEEENNSGVDSSEQVEEVVNKEESSSEKSKDEGNKTESGASRKNQEKDPVGEVYFTFNI